MSKQLMLTLCPDLKKFPKPLVDQPGSQLQNCESCEKPMWVSEKKRTLKSVLKENMLMICYPCGLNKCVGDPSFLFGRERVDI